MELLSGKAVAESVKGSIKQEVADMVAKGYRAPSLAAILVGNDGASMTYVGHKEKTCAELGIASHILRFEDTITEQELIEAIQKVNNDDTIDGLIVQLPLPKHIDESTVIRAIAPQKDVDGFHLENVGKMIVGLDTYLPATPAGIIEMLRHYNIETSGKNCVVIGRSNIVGRPMANLLSQKGNPGDCTVTICHSRTKNLEWFTQNADIVVVAIGVPHFLKGDMIKEGAVVIDVGIHRIEDATRKSGFRLIGDVDFDEVAPKSSYITPVPGGVGVMTIISLMQNTLKAAKGRM